VLDVFEMSFVFISHRLGVEETDENCLREAGDTKVLKGRKIVSISFRCYVNLRIHP